MTNKLYSYKEIIEKSIIVNCKEEHEAIEFIENMKELGIEFGNKSTNWSINKEDTIYVVREGRLYFSNIDYMQAGISCIEFKDLVYISYTEETEEIEITECENEPTKEEKFNYQMLGRLKSDCDCYLNYGNRNKNRLWAKDEKEQINEMKRIYNLFTDSKKPLWLTWEEILKYEERMDC